jgi:hypothetical protein
MSHTTTDLAYPLLKSTTSSNVLATSSRVCTTHHHRRNGDAREELGENGEDRLQPLYGSDRG